jgi:multiple sugar transport system permease protein
MAVLTREEPRAGTAIAASRLGQKRRTQLGRLLLHLVLIAVGLTFLAPFAWLLSTSLKQSGTEFAYPPQWIPHPIMWSNYKTALVTVVPFFTYFKNTMTITVGATVGDVLMSAVVAYSFARLRWPGRNVMFMATLATLMLPSIVTIIPTFLLMRYLHWIDTFYPLIVPAWAGGSAFSIFLFRQFFMTIPLELDEAARMDGANPLRIFWNVIMPLSGPVLATVVIFDVLNNWNDLFNPLIFLNSESNYTMALGLTQYAVGHNGTFYNLQMAASVVMTIPVILLFFFAQRYFMRGIVTTGLATR